MAIMNSYDDFYNDSYMNVIMMKKLPSHGLLVPISEQSWRDVSDIKLVLHGYLPGVEVDEDDDPYHTYFSFGNKQDPMPSKGLEANLRKFAIAFKSYIQ